MTLTIHPLAGIPEIARGDDLPALLLAAIDRAGLAIHTGDVLVVTHKVVSGRGAVAVLAGDEEKAPGPRCARQAVEVISSPRRPGDRRRPATGSSAPTPEWIDPTPYRGPPCSSPAIRTRRRTGSAWRSKPLPASTSR
jgi:hypothetical protein